MPAKPPQFHPPGWKPVERSAWARPHGQPDRRKRGRPGARARAQVLAEEPLCRSCLETGRTSASEIVDHIVPLAWGGSDDRSNKQGLCKACHDDKSKAERAEAARRSALAFRN